MEQKKQAMKLVGVGGQKRNGKDVLSDYLASKLELRSESKAECSTWGRNSFASEVKRIFCETFFFSIDDIDKWKQIDEPPPGFQRSIRECLTFIGDGFRDIMGDVWIRRAFRDETCYYKVISDARYLNEVRKIRDIGGPVLLICHPDRINFTANRSESELRPYILWCYETGREGEIALWPEFQDLLNEDHWKKPMHFSGDESSEQPWETILTGEFVRNLSLFNVFIRNEGTLDDLYAKADSLVIPYIESNFDYSGV